MRSILPLFLAFSLLSAPVSALSAQDVVQLWKAGVSEDVLVALIERDKPIFPMDPDQLITLKREGVSEKVVLAMVRSGQEESVTSSSPVLPSPPPPSLAEPSLVVVGHGPDRPNTFHQFDRFGEAPPYAFYTVPFVSLAPALPCAVGVNRAASPRFRAGSNTLFSASQKFVNSALLPLLETTTPPAVPCVPVSRPNRHR